MSTRRQFIQSLPAVGAAFAVAPHLAFDVSPARAQQIDPLQGHFDPKGKAPSKFTLDVLKQAKAGLPFADKRDFEEQKRGPFRTSILSRALPAHTRTFQEQHRRFYESCNPPREDVLAGVNHATTQSKFTTSGPSMSAVVPAPPTRRPCLEPRAWRLPSSMRNSARPFFRKCSGSPRRHPNLE